MKHLYLLFLLLSCTFMGFAQHGTIRGTMKTSDGKPAAFVSIGLKENNKGTTSDEDGKYEIKNVKPGIYTLVVTSVGLAPEERSVTVNAGETTTSDFSLTENSTQLSEVVISGSNIQNTPVSIGKAAIKPLDLPQSVGVVNSVVIQDQQATRLGDVLKNVSGVSLTQQRQGVAETFSARGYSIGIAGSAGSIFKNGVITNTQGFPDASTLESVEVLKGSSALLYGNVSGGLIINMVTKKPKFDWGGQASFQAGSYDFYKPNVDVYGPISKNLAFRAIATHEDSKSFRDVVEAKRTYVNPSLLYKIGDKTEILLQTDYLKSDIVPDAGVGVPNQNIDMVIPSNTPRSRFINAVWAYNKTEQLTGTLTINHRFNDSWRLNVIGSAQDTEVDGFGVNVPNSIAANGDYTRTLTAVKSGENDYTGQVNLNGNFKTAFLGHQLLVGTDLTHIETESNTFRYMSNGTATNAYDRINIFDRNKYVERTDMPSFQDTARTLSPQRRFGIYAQDMITISKKFKVLAGLRWSYQKAFRTYILNRESGVERRGTADEKVDKAFSPRAALIFQPIENISAYASYSNNFTVNTGTDIYGDPLKPSIVDQYEIGVKNDLFNGKLSANVSVYKIINSNFAQTALFDANGNPNTNNNLKELSGETTSDGVEVDFSGNFSRNFYFIAGYGYNYMRYTNTTGVKGSQVEGERLINNPAHTANGSIFYTFNNTIVRGLKLGASVFYTGQRYGGGNNQVGQTPEYNRLLDLSGFTTLDLSIGYTYRKISFLGKVSNITNELNYIAHDRYSINPIPPRQFIGTLSYKFR
ncbi:TonB-dependent receptor [Chryseosolibacter indicus]|uniref:TonB-dependent siderophore receptor n=1 Tax=Chryseosolibacter indicus TaxID=2782351 RepID=A0ABS5VRL5_9BACT|nr:TonB-dependent receptor [Chryseosolibacter indicus]MBT1703811.1 TonB-dependent siderophore receptor [Chryseosolibacter indicus]